MQIAINKQKIQSLIEENFSFYMDMWLSSRLLAITNCRAKEEDAIFWQTPVPA